VGRGRPRGDFGGQRGIKNESYNIIYIRRRRRRRRRPRHDHHRRDFARARRTSLPYHPRPLRGAPTHTHDAI